MIPAPFEYARPSSLEEATRLLRDTEDAKLIAGGHSLLPLMRLRLARPALLVDLGGLRSHLAGITIDGGMLRVGAMTRHHDVERSPLVRDHVPLLAAATATVGDPQVRHRGTLGGSLAHGDPAADLPAVVLALDATLVVQGPDGRREVPASAFFRGFLETALEPDEVLVEVRIPVPPRGHGWSYVKFNRRAQDWATVAVAALLARSGDGVPHAAVSLVSMGDRPLRAVAVEEALRAGGVGAARAAAQRAAEGTEPPSDLAATAEFRRHLARVLTARALLQALERAAA